jgi:hypothetical protein
MKMKNSFTMDGILNCIIAWKTREQSCKMYEKLHKTKLQNGWTNF